MMFHLLPSCKPPTGLAAAPRKGYMCGQDWAPHRGQPGGPFHFPWKITEDPR